ncbi:hypothetical protein GC197_09030 [bacterium]|nr:hypothetical protein [bacterium]
MSWVDDVLADFGHSLGLPSLEFNEAGVACLSFEILGDLYIENINHGENVLIYVVRELDRPSREIFIKALDLCHWENHHPYSVNAALRGEKHLVFAVNLPGREFSVPAIEQLIQLFQQLHDQAKEGIAA